MQLASVLGSSKLHAVSAIISSTYYILLYSKAVCCGSFVFALTAATPH